MAQQAVQLYLTGRVAVRHGTRIAGQGDLAGDLGRSLLVRLALARYPLTRDLLVEELWAGCPPRAHDSVLNATLSRLRGALGRIGLDGRGVLVAGGGTIELRRPPGCRIDIESAVRAVDAAEGALRRDDTAAAWSAAVVAQSVARRPFLTGLDRSWIDVERDQLTAVHRRAVSVLIEVWARRGDRIQQVEMARVGVRLDPLSERAHRRLVEALVAAGDRGAAAQAVAAWERTAEAELGLAPDGSLRALLPGSVMPS